MKAKKVYSFFKTRLLFLYYDSLKKRSIGMEEATKKKKKKTEKNFNLDFIASVLFMTKNFLELR